MSIIINSLEDYNNINKPDNIIIVKIGADWCTPCKSISPFYYLLALNNKNPNIIYTEIDTTNAKDDLLDFVDVKSLPTFLIYKNNELLNKIIGCDKLTISECLNNLE